MNLTKEQTFELLLNDKKIRQSRYKVTTKFRWKCLKCLTPIYIRHTNISLSSIFCDTCYPLVRSYPTIAQYHYLRKLKEAQLNALDRELSTWIDEKS